MTAKQILIVEDERPIREMIAFGLRRSGFDVREAPDALTQGIDGARTVYDPAITETLPFGGVESALSAFDAHWATGFTFQKNDRQHRAIREAIAAQSPQGARVLAREHVLSSGRLLEAILDKVAAQTREPTDAGIRL